MITSTCSADTDLLSGIESPRDLSDLSIGALISQSLLGNGITIRHKPRTGYRNEVAGGIANDVVTHFVEHAFLTWLLATKHHIDPPTIPLTSNCQSGDVDPEIFFPSDADLDAILWEPTLDDSSDDEVDEEARDDDDEDEAGGITLADLARIVEQNAAKYDECKKVCGGCFSRLDCLTIAVIGNNPFGVWGGLDERERHLMINRFNAMRRSYANGTMHKGMRTDFEERATQITSLVTREAQSERQMRAIAA